MGGSSKPGSIMSFETRECEEVAEPIIVEEGRGGTMEAHDEALSIHQDNQRLVSDSYAQPSSLVSILTAGPRLGYKIVVTGSSLATSAALLPFQIALLPLTIARDVTNTILDNILPSISNPDPVPTPRRLSDPGNTSIDPGTPIASSKAPSLLEVKVEERNEKGIVMSVVETSFGIGQSSRKLTLTAMDPAKAGMPRAATDSDLEFRFSISLYRYRRSRLRLDATVSREGCEQGVAVSVRRRESVGCCLIFVVDLN